MIISLIGMSGSGKSYWSRLLEKLHGFQRFSCDELIANRLVHSARVPKIKSTRDLALWMGMPDAPGFAEREKLYLDIEREVLEQSLEEATFITSQNPHVKIVIDTTGSVIYTGEKILSSMQQLSSIILLDSSPEHEQALYEQFLADPKPIVWGNAYRYDLSCSRQEVLRTSFRGLLDYRTGIYRNLAAVIIDYQTHNSLQFSSAALIEIAKNQ